MSDPMNSDAQTQKEPSTLAGQTIPHKGMSLRDYFAGQALASGLVRADIPEYDLIEIFGRNRTAIRREEIIAADAYRIADAMLARQHPPQDTTAPEADHG